jgi:hypothetical protein
MTTYWGASKIASRLGVTTEAVRKWIDRFADTAAPFPAPDVEIEEADGRLTRGWSADRWKEIEHWSTRDRYKARFAGQRQRASLASEAVPNAELATKSSGQAWESLVQNAEPPDIRRLYHRPKK